MPVREMVVALALAGCAVSLRGAVVPGDDGATLLQLPDGRTRRLVLDAGSAPLAGLDGEMAQIEGKAGIGGVRVAEWSVPQGTRGLQVWVGVLERRDGRLRVVDRNARAVYLVDDQAVDSLSEAVGRTVLLEGWVEHAMTVRVAYARVLDRAAPAR